MRFSAACVVIALALPSSGLSAQEVVQIEPGQRVRVTVPELGVDRRIAELESLDSRTLTVVTDSRLRFPLTALIRPELSVLRGSRLPSDLPITPPKNSTPW